jgi:hypothetical protein
VSKNVVQKLKVLKLIAYTLFELDKIEYAVFVYNIYASTVPFPIALQAGR